ncbi:MAG: deoxyribodipyrimidine photo-lyase [Rhizobiales bacterium TMED83]|nr:deoxyribodipyrimidine photolyase [Rhodobiaceae bacterium]RPF92656.1 MAG: deoxyribodipyrimidine photo-lyase [Rhizobiales bacterium TMED83]
MSQPVIVWFRQDLRLNDNPAFAAAIQSNAPIIPVFVDDTAYGRAAGTTSLWWRNTSLRALAGDLKTRGLTLIYRKGDGLALMRALVEETNAATVFWNRQYEKDTIARDTQLKSWLKENNRNGVGHVGNLFFDPWQIINKNSGSHYKVFSPFWKACLQAGLPCDLSVPPAQLTAPEQWPKSQPLPEASAAPATGMDALWQPGERGALKMLDMFFENSFDGYADNRDTPGGVTTSRLSPHLRWGEISPQRIYASLGEERIDTNDGRKFLSEIGWREFSYYLLYHYPDMPERCLQQKFETFPWRDAPEDLEAWKQGRTGYPIVDAAMRELATTGFMHNRTRMIAASFLTKHLLIDWREGERWFWECLADADPANNAAGWQWTAGCGADAAPYFRIFNPIIQGRKFDPDGTYTKTYAPELANLTGKVIFAPWEASSDTLSDAGISLDVDYPAPIVKHETARARALDVFHAL